MAELYGWTGKILRVDLTAGKTWTIDTEQYVPKYLGGMGIAAKIAWDELKPGTDAFDPDNLLFLMVGPLTGTMASGGGRVLVAGIAPQLKPSIFSRSGMGGHWGAELKFAGFDGVIVQGKAEKPVYLYVHDGECEIMDADELWGTGTYNTTAQLRQRHGRKTRVASIGQAGENLARMACIQTETGNAAGQGGYGALMGSKNLKAIAIRGTGGVKVADPKRVLDLAMGDPKEPAWPTIPQEGGPQRGNWPEPPYNMRRRKCGFCATPCGDRLFMDVPAEVGHGNYTAVQQCWGYRTEHQNGHIQNRALTADWGINGWEISYGLIPWLQICKQHGLIDSIDGVNIDVPDKEIFCLNDCGPTSAELIATIQRKVAFRDDEFGDIIADGTCYAAEKLFDGKGLEFVENIYPRKWGETNHWNGHWGTGGQPWFPFWLVPVLQFCFDVRDPASDSTHQYTEHVLRYAPEHGPNRGPITFEEAAAVCEAVYGDAECLNPKYTYDRPETKVLPAIFHHNRGMIVESLVLCDRENTRVFSSTQPGRKADTAMMSKMFSAVTGFETTEEELDLAGERVFNLVRAIDCKLFGRSREIDDEFAVSMTQPSFVDGVAMDIEKFRPMMDCYYEKRGWNVENGYPTRAKLEQLGMDDVADQLETENKLG